MHGTIKKNYNHTHTHIYIYIWIQIILSISFIFFILISFGYTREFTISFNYYFFVYWVFDDLFILEFSSFAPH